jgi:hypothetical protein
VANKRDEIDGHRATLWALFDKVRVGGSTEDFMKLNVLQRYLVELRNLKEWPFSLHPQIVTAPIVATAMILGTIIKEDERFLSLFRW